MHMTITTQHTQESLSRAYVTAVAGRAGLNMTLGQEYDYGVDGSFHSVVIGSDGRRVNSGSTLDFQLKASKNWKFNKQNDQIGYNLEAKTYNDLVMRDPDCVGIILILFCLPSNSNHWLSVTEDQLILRNCCYWIRLEGNRTSNAQTKKIFIPSQNLLDVQALKELMINESVRRKEAMR